MVKIVSNREVSTFTFQGKRYYCYGKTKAEAKRNASVRKALLSAGHKEIKSGYTVRQWCSVWSEVYRTDSSEWSKQVKQIVDNHITPVLGSKLMRDVRPLDLTMLMNQHDDWSKSHKQKLLQIIKQIFSTAVENDIIIKDPSKHVKIGSYNEKKPRRTITSLERELTLKTARKHQEGLFFLLMLFCGLRPQEVARLEWRDIDLEKRVIHVQRSRKADGVTGAPKSSAGVRDIPIPTPLMEFLHPAQGLVCTSEQGRPLTKTSQQRLWKKFKRWMDIENGAKIWRGKVIKTTLAADLEPYCYRHTYCTDLQDAGVPLTVASRLMGHSSIQVTADIYTHHSKESFEDATEKIEKYMSNVVNSVVNEAQAVGITDNDT